MNHAALIASFPTLRAQGRLLHCEVATEQIEQESRSLMRLRQRTADYLNGYDRLFRHYSLLALAHGYQIPSERPHQTFRLMSQIFVPADEVMAIIETRHRLKHERGSALKPESGVVHTLCQLLHVFDERDAQACGTHLL